MKRVILSLLASCLVAVSSFFIFTSSVKAQVTELGYSEKETEKLITKYGVFDVGAKVVLKLNEEIDEKEAILETEIGVSTDIVKDKEELAKVEYNKELDTVIDETRTMYVESIKEVDTELAKYPEVVEIVVDDLTLVEVYEVKSEILTTLQDDYNSKIEEHKSALLDFGMRESEITALLTGNAVDDLNILTAKRDYYNEYQALVSTSGNSYASGSMDLFNMLNAHRTSKGLPAFRYNAEGQSCVDIETNAYANNKNPHNWLCKSLTSEGSSLASVNSNYINIAGTFLTTHDSHEADVVNPNYTSAACSAVQKDNMVYMICGYFR